MRMLIRAGYKRARVDLFLAQRSLAKIAALVRAELEALGGQEMHAPPDTPLSAAASGGLRSYKQLPQVWYQVRFPGSVEIVTFDLNQDLMDAKRRAVEQAFGRVLTLCGVPFTLAEAQSGSREGRASALVVPSPTGMMKMALCDEAGYAAALDVAHAMPKAPGASDPDGTLGPERFHTPDRKTIADLADFTGLQASSQMKSLVQVCDGKPYLVLVRGDHQLARPKLAAFVGAGEAIPASPVEIAKWFGANPGSLGPVGVKDMPILADLALQGRRNMVCGANEDDYHLRNVTPGVDFPVEFADLRQVDEGDMCPSFPAAISIRTAHELARISFPGPQYASTLSVKVDESGREVLPFMTVSTSTLDSLLTVAAELNQDQDGLTLSRSLAPFDLVITPANFADDAQRQAALELYDECRDLDVLLDDRDERPGVKFKDADLIGIPMRITVGKKLAEGLVEVVVRRGRQKSDVPVADAVAHVRSLL